MKTVLVVEDDAFTRDGLTNYLQALMYQVTAVADMKTAWAEITTATPDLTVIDVRIPVEPSNTATAVTEPNGLTLAKNIKRTFPKVGIVLLSAHEQYEREVIQWTQTGVRCVAFLHKGGDMGRLAQALNEVAAGRNLYSRQITNPVTLETAVRQHLHPDESYWIDLALTNCNTLSEREREIANLLAAANTPEQIAEQLHLARGSVDNIVSRIYRKLGLDSVRSITVDSDQPAQLRPLPLLVKACLIYDIRNNH